MGALKITGQSAEPTVTASDAGTLYYDSDTNKLRHYNGSAWADVSPAVAALTSADLPAGSVLQVLQTVKDDKQSATASGSVNWTDITGLLQAITPSATSSKILIHISVTYGSATYSGFMRIQAKTASGAYADLAVGDNTGTTGQSKITMGTVGGTADPAEVTTASAMFLDSPNTTSERTYKVQFTSRHTDTMTINYGQSNVNGDYIGVGISSITLMEISG